MLGKALLTEPRVLLLDEPTRGIDVGAKADIFTLMTELAGRGLAVLFATSELEEALHVPDRLLVMAKGKVVREVRRGAATQGGDHGSQRKGASDERRPAAERRRTPRRKAKGRRLKAFNLILEGRAFIALIAIVIVFGLLSDAYLTWDNLVTMTKHVAINAILAIGMLMVILTGGIDLSVGSIVGLAGIVAGVLLEGLHLGFANTIVYLPVWGVVIVALLVGTGVGAVNGTLVTRFNVAPFIATLGHAVHGARRGAADLQRRDLSEPGRVAGARQHRLRLPRDRADRRHPDLDLADGRCSRSRRCS